MGAGDCCAKAIIIIINIFFFLLGLAFVAAGVVYLVGKDVIGKLLENAFEEISIAANGTDSAGADAALEAAEEFLDIFQPLFIALLVLGIVMIITSILAMCGSCCSVNCMLITYVVIVILIFCAHVALFICLMVGAFSGNIKEGLQKSIDKEFVGIKDTLGAYSIGWNLIMSQYQCCGIENWQDFENAEKWNRDPTNSGEQLKTPVACCMMDDGEIAEEDDWDCAYNPTDKNSNYETGCWGAVNEQLVEPQKNVIIGVNCAFLGFELILAALTLCIIFQSRKENNY